MDWKTDSGLDESEEEAYSSFQSNKSGKLFDRMEFPIILIGAGLLVLIILFVLFIPKKNEITIDDFKHLASRLDQLEDKIDVISGKEIDIREFDPSKNPVQYQQVINWIKSNAEVLSETIKKVDEIEKNLKITEKTKPAADVKLRAKKPVQQKQKTAAVSKPPEKPKPIPVAESKPLEKSKPVRINPQEKSKPEVKSKPKSPPKTVVAAHEPKILSKPVVVKPEIFKLIFHRVEKGETLYRISRNYGISVEELQKLNDMKKNDLIIDIGQELIVKKVKQ